MKKENILTYNDVETILIALMGRAMDERKRANTAENEKDDETAEYHAPRRTPRPRRAAICGAVCAVRYRAGRKPSSRRAGLSSTIVYPCATDTCNRIKSQR